MASELGSICENVAGIRLSKKAYLTVRKRRPAPGDSHTVFVQRSPPRTAKETAALAAQARMNSRSIITGVPLLRVPPLREGSK